MPQFLKEWWPVISWGFSFVFSGVAMWGVWSMKKGLVTRDAYEKDRKEDGNAREAERTRYAEDVQQIHARVNRANDRIDDRKREHAVLKERVDALPAKDDVHGLGKSVEELRGDVKGLTARVDGLGQILARIEHPLNLLLEHQVKGGG